MTVTSGSDTYKLYSGNGTTHVFAYTFRVFTSSELLVLIRNNTTGATHIATDTARSGAYDPDTHVGGEGLNTAYILSGVDDANGGNVTFKYDTGNPSDANYSTTDYRPQTGESVIIIRVPAISQETNYVPGGAFPAESHEDALDKLTFHVQRIEDQLNKTIQRPEADTGVVSSSIDSSLSVLPDNADLKGKYLSFNSSTGAPEAGANVSDVALLASSQTLTNKTINADNNTISNIEVDNLKASAVVTEAEGIQSNDNDTSLPTSAAVKDYVDSQATGETLNVNTDGGNFALTIDSETLTFDGGSGITTSSSGTTVQIDIDTSVVTLNDTQTLTNKSIDAAQLTGTIDDARIPVAATDSAGLMSAADKTKMDGIETGATADQTAAEIKTAYESNSDTNAFTDADHTKLDGIEASADVTDTANVTAAGALMDSEVTNLAQVKAFDSSDYATAAQGTTADAAMPKAGGTFTGDVTFTGDNYNIVFDKSDNALEFGDDAKAVFGDSGDLRIYHGSGRSVIEDIGTGRLLIKTNDLDLTNATGSEKLIKAYENGAVELYYDGTKRFETLNTGAKVSGELQVTGDLTVSGTTTTVNSTVVTLDDPILTLGGDTAPSVDDNKDRGVEFRWHDGSAAKVGFFGFDDSTGRFTFIPDATNTSEVFSGTKGDLDVGDLNVTGLVSLPDGSSTDNYLGIGNSDEFKIYHDGNQTVISNVNGSGPIKLQGKFGEQSIIANQDGAVELYHNNSKKFETTSDGTLTSGEATIEAGGSAGSSVDTLFLNSSVSGTTGSGSKLYLQGGTGGNSRGAIIEGVNTTGGGNGHSLKFYTNASTASPANRMTISHGGDVTIESGNLNLGDDQEIRLGDSDDFKLFHKSSTNQSIINEGGAGSMLIQASNMFLQNNSGGQTYAKFTDGGAAELYHNAVKVFETTASGAKIHGNTGDAVLLLEADTTNTDEGDNAYIEYSQDGGGVTAQAGLGVNGDNSYRIHTTTGSGTTYFDIYGGSNTKLFYGTSEKLRTTSDGIEITSLDDGATDSPILSLYRDSASPADSDDIGQIAFRGKNDAAQQVDYGLIVAEINDASDGTESGELQFVHIHNGSGVTPMQHKFGKVYINNGPLELAAGVDLRFEGATSNSNETTLTVADPTADRTITLPDATGTVLLQDSNGDVDIISTDDGNTIGPKLHLYRDSASPADFDDIGSLYFTGNDSGGNRQEYAYIRGDIYDTTNTTEDAAIRYFTRVGGNVVEHMQHAFGQTYVYGKLYLSSNSIHSNPHIQFEGSTANNFETSLYAADPTDDRTITLPDATGEVVLKDSSDVVTISSTATGGPKLRLKSDDPADANDFGTEGQIEFYAENDASEQVLYADILNATADISDGSEDGWLYFRTATNGAIKSAFAAANGSLYLVDDASVVEWRSWGGTPYHVTLTPSTPTASRTITLPDATGTVVVQDGSGHINLGDNEEIKLGDSGDLRILHDGGNSYIWDDGAGDLFLRSSNNHYLQFANGDYALLTTEDAAVKLRYNNADRIQTLNSGALVQSNVTGTTLEIRNTNNSTGTSRLAFGTDDGSVYNQFRYDWDADEFQWWKQSNNIMNLSAGGLTVSSQENNGPVLKLVSDDHADSSDYSREARITFTADNTANQATDYASISLITEDVTDSTEDGRITFQNIKNGTTQTSHTFGSNVLILHDDGHFITWQQTRGTNFNVNLYSPTPTATRDIFLPDGSGTIALENGNARLLNTTTVSSGVSSVDFGSSLITDAFDNYLLVVEDLTVSAATDICIRLGTANSADTSSIYTSNCQWRGKALTSTTNNTQNFSSTLTDGNRVIFIGGNNQDIATASTQSANFSIRFDNLRSTTFHKTANGLTGGCFITDTVGDNSGVDYICGLRDFCMTYQNTSAVNFLTIFDEDVASQISGGTFSLYGLKT